MWLGFLCAMFGLVVAGMVFKAGPVRGALYGLAVGLVITVGVNVVGSKPAPCLQESRGLDILRAWQTCPQR